MRETELLIEATKLVGETLRDQVLEAILDLERFPWWDRIGDYQRLGLLDMRVALGAEGFREFEQLFQALHSGWVREAGYEIRKSSWARQAGRRANLDAYLVEHNAFPPVGKGGSNDTGTL